MKEGHTFNPMDFQNIVDSYKTSILGYKKHKMHKHQHWRMFFKQFDQYLQDDEIWKDFRRNAISLGMNDSVKKNGDVFSQVEIQRILNNFQYIKDRIEQDMLDFLNDNNIGNPIGFYFDGRFINRSIIDFVYFADSIKRIINDRSKPLKIIEIGGGYGGLARILKQVYPNAKMVLFDLPESNTISTYYLSHSFPNAKMMIMANYEKKKLFEADFTVLPGWLMTEITGNSVDLVINTRSMMEMEKIIVDQYVEQIQRVTKPGGYFYCVNRYEKSKSSWKRPFLFHEMPFDKKWEVVFLRTKWDQRRIGELMIQREEKECLDVNIQEMIYEIYRETQSPIHIGKVSRKQNIMKLFVKLYYNILRYR
mgnify:CR=1 FL=1